MFLKLLGLQEILRFYTSVGQRYNRVFRYLNEYHQLFLVIHPDQTEHEHI